MSNIAIHDLSARARARMGRIAQVEALPPQLDRHQGDHWQLNRISSIVPRKPRNDPEELQPWQEQVEQNIILALRGVAATTSTLARRVPYQCVIREIHWATIPGTAGASTSIDISASGYGSVFGVTSDAPQLTSLAYGPTSDYHFDPRIIIASRGSEVIVTLITGVGGDSHISVRIQPLAQFLRGL